MNYFDKTFLAAVKLAAEIIFELLEHYYSRKMDKFVPEKFAPKLGR